MCKTTLRATQNWSEVPCVCPIKPTLNLKKHFIRVKVSVVHVLSDLGFSCVSFAKLMKTLFAHDWKGPPEFICRLHWCFPCPLEELNEEVVRAVHPQPAAGTSPPPVVSQGPRNKPLLCSGDGGHRSIRSVWSRWEAWSLKVSAGFKASSRDRLNLLWDPWGS